MDHPSGQDTYEGVVAVVEYDYKAKELDELDLCKGQVLHKIVQQPGGWWEGTLTLSGRTGMFPDNFVRVLETNENNTVVLRDKSSSVQRRCKAIYSYTQVNEDELSLAVGDVIEFLGEVEEGWWRGKLSNKVGVFPSNFVVKMQTSPVFATKRPIHAAEANSLTTASKPITTVHKIPPTSVTKNQNNSKDDGHINSRIPALVDTPGDNYIAPILPPRPVREFCRVEFPYSPQNEDELELAIGEIIAIVNKDLPDKGWWKGEVHGKVGVFPNNFVKLIPLDDSPVNDTRTTQADPVPKAITKKNINSNTPNTSRLESFGSRDSLDDILNETGIQSGNVAAQRKSLENKNFELITPSTAVDRTSKHLDLKTGDTRKSIENLDDKKTPPPLLTKKPTVPNKKASSVTNVAGSILSGLKQKVKNVEQKFSMSQDANDGGTSSKYNLEPIDNNEKVISSDRLLDGDSDFDKVERASILQDVRAGRVKAPKRRPPSVATNLMTDSTIRNSVYLNGIDDSVDEFKNPPSSSADSDEQVKPKGREWEKKKVPWMDELKASQVKKKSSPYIEPRTTLVDTNAKSGIEEKQSSSSSVMTTISKNKKGLDNSNITNVATTGQTVVTKSSTSLYQSVSVDNKIESETDVANSISSDTVTNKVTAKESIMAEDTEVKTPPKSAPVKINVSRTQTQQSKSSTSSTSVVINSTECTELAAPEGPKIVELEKRVQSLEAIVHVQQTTIDDLQKMLRDESHRVELLQNQLEKYAQCVTQV